MSLAWLPATSLRHADRLAWRSSASRGSSPAVGLVSSYIPDSRETQTQPPAAAGGTDSRPLPLAAPGARQPRLAPERSQPERPAGDYRPSRSCPRHTSRRRVSSAQNTSRRHNRPRWPGPLARNRNRRTRTGRSGIEPMPRTNQTRGPTSIPRHRLKWASTTERARQSVAFQVPS